eukprot:607057-Amorphochlora_amoeboformis.AAC.1
MQVNIYFRNLLTSCYRLIARKNTNLGFGISVTGFNLRGEGVQLHRFLFVVFLVFPSDRSIPGSEAERAVGSLSSGKVPVILKFVRGIALDGDLVGSGGHFWTLTSRS